MSNGYRSTPWGAICSFCAGSITFLIFLGALADPTMCAKHCMGVSGHIATWLYLLFGPWGVRAFLLLGTVMSFWIPFATATDRDY